MDLKVLDSKLLMLLSRSLTDLVSNGSWLSDGIESEWLLIELFLWVEFAILNKA